MRTELLICAFIALVFGVMRRRLVVVPTADLHLVPLRSFFRACFSFCHSDLAPCGTYGCRFLLTTEQLYLHTVKQMQQRKASLAQKSANSAPEAQKTTIMLRGVPVQWWRKVKSEATLRGLTNAEWLVANVRF